MAKTDLTAERLREILDYNPETGVFIRIVSTCPTARAGDVAGAIKPSGYVYIGVVGNNYLAHRLAWLHTYGTWPSGVVDHINGSKGDNRIENLRDVTVAENSQNMRSGHKDSASEYLGVSRKRGKWRAGIYYAGKHISLGSFFSQEAASEAYMSAKAVYHARATSEH